MKAFPSYIQAYSKHQASFIFRMNELDIPSIAYSWGLLKLPRMPELKSRQILWTPPSVDVCQSYEIIANIFSGRIMRMRIRRRKLLDGMQSLRNLMFVKKDGQRRRRGQRRLR